MVQQSFDTEKSILSGIKEGMTVYDSENRKLGAVAGLHFGASSQTANDQGTGSVTAVDPDKEEDSIMNDFLKALFGGSPLPEVVRDRLILNGFIRIDSKGLFTTDRYAMPDQIASVVGQNVRLKVTGVSLIGD